jgi:polysaccharide biosynthesis/export protein
MLAGCLSAALMGCAGVDLHPPLSQISASPGAETPRELLAGGSVNAVYTPSLPAPVLTEPERDRRLLAGDPTSEADLLLRPAPVLPERESSTALLANAPAKAVYMPSLRSPVLAEQDSSRELWLSGPANAVYTPSLPAPVLTEAEGDRRWLAGDPANDIGLLLRPAPVLPEQESSKALLASCSARDLYAPTPERPVPEATPLKELLPGRAIDLYAASQTPVSPEFEAPRELSLMSLPTYRIEPPDILQIEALKLVPLPPYRLDAYDVVQVRVQGTLLNQPIDGFYLVEGDGTVVLGPTYGMVRVLGMTVEEATRQITRQLQTTLQEPHVSIQLARSAATQQVTGTYAVEPDGRVNLRQYGMVHVAGKTVTEARVALEQRMAQYFDLPQVSVDVVGYNSKSYYVIAAGAGMGENILRFPIVGNETVLDGIAQLQGFSPLSSQTIWVSRPAPGGFGSEQVLPVDWMAISRGGATRTNYQLLPGDRIYIVDDNLIAANSYINKLTTPIERLLNIGILGTSMARSAQTLGRAYNTNRP